MKRYIHLLNKYRWQHFSQHFEVAFIQQCYQEFFQFHKASSEYRRSVIIQDCTKVGMHFDTLYLSRVNFLNFVLCLTHFIAGTKI